MDKRRLLILSCSARKQRVTGKVAAWDLYDGVAFRVVKRLQREERFADDLDILILSAQHGLIRPSRKIAFYSLRMTKELAARQASRNGTILRVILHGGNYGEVFALLGRTYLLALNPSAAWLSHGLTLTVAEGGIGQKMKQMKGWLLSNGPRETALRPKRLSHRGHLDADEYAHER